jgi:multidrug efflux pump subunit AcrB
LTFPSELATIQGASVPIPYGGKVRQIMVDINSQKLLSKGLSPMDVVNAVNTQNVVLPSGTQKSEAQNTTLASMGIPQA